MKRIPESLLHELWRLLPRLASSLATTRGEDLIVHSPGVHNHDAGPDFLNASVSIGGLRWYGHVELHVQASDWHRHGHGQDPQYRSVILHVVAHDDAEVLSQRGQPIPTLVLPKLERLLALYDELHQQAQTPACGNTLSTLAPIVLEGWTSRLLVERLEAKTAPITDEVATCELGWEEAFYRSLARSLGQTVNAEAMESLARATPLKLLLKLRGQLHAVEAVLFGQSGLLGEGPTEEGEADSGDAYVQGLVREYAFQASKHQLTPLGPELWRYLRLRPASFPTVRIAQLAALLTQWEHVFSLVVQAKDLREIERLFGDVSTSAYWDMHYRFGTPAKRRTSKTVGKDRIRLIIINTVIPFRFAYARSMDEPELQESTLEMLSALPPEDNRVVRQFEAQGLVAHDAAKTQALLELHKRYCGPRLCHLCPAGQELLIARGYRTALCEPEE